MSQEERYCLGAKNVEVIQVIVTTLARRGDGSQERPIRGVTQIWSMQGDLLADLDPLPEL